MAELFSRLRVHWPALSFLLSAAMLAGAHGFERFGGLAPCALCLDQREYHWGVVSLAVACFVLMQYRPGWSRLAAGALGFAFLASAGMAAYHVAVEQHWVIAQCEAVGDLSQIRLLDDTGPITAPSCDQIAWRFLGVSMAGWNLAISLAAGLLSFAVALWPNAARP